MEEQTSTRTIPERIAKILKTYADWLEGSEQKPDDHPEDRPFLGPEKILKLIRGDIQDRVWGANLSGEEAGFLDAEVRKLYAQAKERQGEPLVKMLPFIDDTLSPAMAARVAQHAVYHFEVFDPRNQELLAMGTCWDIQSHGEVLTFWIGNGRDRQALLQPDQPRIHTEQRPLRSFTLGLRNGDLMSFLRIGFEGEKLPVPEPVSSSGAMSGGNPDPEEDEEEDEDEGDDDLEDCSTLGTMRYFQVRGSIETGVEYYFPRGEGRYSAEQFRELLAHFAGQKRVLLGAHPEDAIPGSVGHFIEQQIGVNHAAYIAPILAWADRMWVTYEEEDEEAEVTPEASGRTDRGMTVDFP